MTVADTMDIPSIDAAVAEMVDSCKRKDSFTESDIEAFAACAKWLLETEIKATEAERELLARAGMPLDIEGFVHRGSSFADEVFSVLVLEKRLRVYNETLSAYEEPLVCDTRQGREVGNAID